MSSVTPYDANYRNLVEQNLRQTTEAMKTGGMIADLYSSAEQEVISAWSAVGKADAATQGTKEALAHEAEQKYRRISRMYEGFQQILKNADETMRRVISNMGFR